VTRSDRNRRSTRAVSARNASSSPNALLAAGALAVVLGLGLAGCGTAVDGNGNPVSTASPARLAIGNAQGTAAGAPNADGKLSAGSMLSMWAGYKIEGQLPTTPNESPVLRWNDGQADESVVRALAEAFGIKATPKRAAHGWTVKDGTGELKVRDGDGSMWSYTRADSANCPLYGIDVTSDNPYDNAVGCAIAAPVATPTPVDGTPSPEPTISKSDIESAAAPIRAALTNAGTLINADATARVDAYGPEGSITLSPSISGMPTSGVETLVNVDGQGIKGAMGRLTVPTGDVAYPIDGAGKVLTRENVNVPLGAPEARSAMPAFCGPIAIDDGVGGGVGVGGGGVGIAESGVAQSGSGSAGGSDVAIDTSGTVTVAPGQAVGGPLLAPNAPGSTPEAPVANPVATAVIAPTPAVEPASPIATPEPATAEPTREPAPVPTTDPNAKTEAPVPCPTPEPTVVTGATLGLQVQHEGNYDKTGSDIMVPAWFYTTKGSDYPIVLIAVSPSLIAGPTPQDPTGGSSSGSSDGSSGSGQSSPDQSPPVDVKPTDNPVPPVPVSPLPEPGVTDGGSSDASAVTYAVTKDANAITLNVWTGTCDTLDAAQVSSDAKTVTIAYKVIPPDPATVCNAMAVISTVVVKLDAPLGDRTVINSVTGDAIALDTP